MKQRAGSEFQAERARHVLRFTCEHCTYFATGTESCSHGYPNALHREARYADTDPELELVFCKDFELR